jgi:hypothetical protein
MMFSLQHPRTRSGMTTIIGTDRGHLMGGIERSSENPWGNFVGTWDLPSKVPGQGDIHKLFADLRLDKRTRLDALRNNTDPPKKDVFFGRRGKVKGEGCSNVKTQTTTIKPHGSANVKTQTSRPGSTRRSGREAGCTVERDKASTQADGGSDEANKSFTEVKYLGSGQESDTELGSGRNRHNLGTLQSNNSNSNKTAVFGATQALQMP